MSLSALKSIYLAYDDLSALKGEEYDLAYRKKIFLRKRLLKISKGY